ncbi:hypothetical protein PENTCL1PPCAC_23824, partial [Pristionchus entomophagus]
VIMANKQNKGVVETNKPITEDDVFSVEKILNRRVHEAGNVEYLVKWEGYPLNEATWENEYNLSQCPDLIMAFERERMERSMQRKEHEVKNIDESDEKVIGIIGMYAPTEKTGEKYFMVDLKGKDGATQRKMMNVKEVHSRYLQEALDFYAKHVKFTS